jgi:hypothetical protein
MVIDGPLPARLDIEMLREMRDTVYAIIQALDGTLDESLPFIGRLVEIDRRIAALTPIEFTDHGASETRTAKRGAR